MTPQPTCTCCGSPDCPRWSIPAPLVDAKTLAVYLDVTPDYVYRHAAALGAVALPSGGEKPRLRFSIDRAMAVSSSKTSQEGATSDAVHDSDPAPPRKNRSKRRNPPERRLNWAPLTDAEREAS